MHNTGWREQRQAGSESATNSCIQGGGGGSLPGREEPGVPSINTIDMPPPQPEGRPAGGRSYIRAAKYLAPRPPQQLPEFGHSRSLRTHALSVNGNSTPLTPLTRRHIFPHQDAAYRSSKVVGHIALNTCWVLGSQPGSKGRLSNSGHVLRPRTPVGKKQKKNQKPDDTRLVAWVPQTVDIDKRNSAIAKVLPNPMCEMKIFRHKTQGHHALPRCFSPLTHPEAPWFHWEAYAWLLALAFS